MHICTSIQYGIYPLPDTGTHLMLITPACYSLQRCNPHNGRRYTLQMHCAQTVTAEVQWSAEVAAEELVTAISAEV